MERTGFSNDFGGQQPVYTPTSDEKTLGVLAHALTFASTFLAPLIIYLLKKDDSKFVADQAKESLNFQITVLLACIVLFITVIGVLVVAIVATVLVIVASIKVSEGKAYRYPFTIRFIK